MVNWYLWEFLRIVTPLPDREVVRKTVSQLERQWANWRLKITKNPKFRARTTIIMTTIKSNKNNTILVSIFSYRSRYYKKLINFT